MDTTEDTPLAAADTGPSLHWADYVILVSFLCVSISIGLYHAFSGGRQRTTSEFIMADRKLKVLPTMMSLLVSFQSAIMILGIPAEVYMYGTQLWSGSIIGFTLALLGTERIIIPWMYPLHLTSIYEYFELRFESKLVRIIAALLGIMSAVMYMAVAMYAPSLALQVSTGIPLTVSIPLMATVCTVYTTLGGMKAVIWTDVFQFLVIFCGVLAALTKAWVEVGGIQTAFNITRQHDRLRGLDFNPDPTLRHSFWTCAIGVPLLWMNIYGLQQASLQRYSAMPTLNGARKILLLNIPCLYVLESVVFLTGIFMLAYFASNRCDPLASGLVDNQNQIMALFVNELFSGAPGISGLFLATLYSGALSSVSSSLSGAAANTWMDIVRMWRPNMGELRATYLNKALVVFYGVVATGVSFLIAMVPGPVTQIANATSGNVMGAMIGLFILGGCFSIADWKSCLVGGLCGFVVNTWVSMGSMTVTGYSEALPPVPMDGCDPPIFNYTLPEQIPLEGLDLLYCVSYLYYSVLGAGVTVTVGLLVALIPGEKPFVDPKLLVRWKAVFEWDSPQPKDVKPAEPPATSSMLEEKVSVM